MGEFSKLVSSVDLVSILANCRGSSVSSRVEVMEALTSNSKHFITIEVNWATVIQADGFIFLLDKDDDNLTLKPLTGEVSIDYLITVAPIKG